MLEKNDASLLLVFDPSPSSATSSEERDLPLRIYQTAHDAVGANLGGVRLARVGGWKIESGEAERVAVSSVSQDQFGGASPAGESSRVSPSRSERFLRFAEWLPTDPHLTPAQSFRL